MTHTLLDGLDLAVRSGDVKRVEERAIESRRTFLEEKRIRDIQRAYETKKLINEITDLASQRRALLQTSGEASEKLKEQNSILNELIKRHLLIYNEKVIKSDGIDFHLFDLFYQKKSLLFTRFLICFMSDPQSLFSSENNFFQQEINDFIALIQSSNFLLKKDFDLARAQLIHFFMTVRALISYTNNYLCPEELKKQLEQIDQTVLLALCDKLHPYGEESAIFIGKVAMLYVRYIDQSFLNDQSQSPGYHGVYIHTHMAMFLPQMINETILTREKLGPSKTPFIELISLSTLKNYLYFVSVAKKIEDGMRGDLDSLFELSDPAEFPFCFMPDFFLYLRRSAKNSIDNETNQETVNYYRNFIRRCDEKLLIIKAIISKVPEEDRYILVEKAHSRLARYINSFSEKKGVSKKEEAWFNSVFLQEAPADVSRRTKNSLSHGEPSNSFSVGELSGWEGETLPVTPFRNPSYDRVTFTLKEESDVFFFCCLAQWKNEKFYSLVERVKREFSPEDVKVFYERAVNTCLEIVKKHQYCYWMARFIDCNQEGEWDWGNCKRGNYGREYVNIAQRHFKKGLEHIVTTLELLKEAETGRVDQEFLIQKITQVQRELDLMNEGLTDFYNDSQVKAKFFRERAQARREHKVQRAEGSEELLVQGKKLPMPETVLHTSGYSFFGDTVEEINRLKGITARL